MTWRFLSQFLLICSLQTNYHQGTLSCRFKFGLNLTLKMENVCESKAKVFYNIQFTFIFTNMISILYFYITFKLHDNIYKYVNTFCYTGRMFKDSVQTIFHYFDIWHNVFLY